VYWLVAILEFGSVAFEPITSCSACSIKQRLRSFSGSSTNRIEIKKKPVIDRSAQSNTTKAVIAITNMNSSHNHAIEYLYDVQYSSLSERLKLDLFQPAHAAEKLPLIIYIHGGGWVDRDKSSKYFSK
jgi:acetyl esterase/lipase